MLLIVNFITINTKNISHNYSRSWSFLSLLKKSLSSFFTLLYFIFVNYHKIIPFFCSISTISFFILAIACLVDALVFVFSESFSLFFIFAYISVIFYYIFYNCSCLSLIIPWSEYCLFESYLKLLVISCLSSTVDLNLLLIFFYEALIISRSSSIFLTIRVDAGLT